MSRQLVSAGRRMCRLHLRVPGLLAAVALGMALAACRPTDSGPDESACIAFTRHPFTQRYPIDPSEIWVMAPDGSHKTRVVGADPGGRQPAWSPDGRKIAFISFEDHQLCVVNADGSGLTWLTRGRPTVWTLCGWSPDGKKILFMREGKTTAEIDKSEIWVISADGTAEVMLTDDAVDWGDPSWSPDGSKIMFVRWVGASSAICLMNADGSGQIQLTGLEQEGSETGAESDHRPAWSPDGSQIAFARGMRLYLMRADGSQQAPVQRSADWFPGFLNSVWSPNGSTILAAYSPGTGMPDELHRINADGSGRMQLTADASPYSRPVWSPDGESIAFVSDRDGPYQIYVMRSDGSGQTNISKNPASSDGAPAWWGPPSPRRE